MSTDPDQIRQDIERTRAELSSDVDALTDKVSPTQAAQRQAERLRGAAAGVKDRLMGGVSDAREPARCRLDRLRSGLAGVVAASQHPSGAASCAVREGAGCAAGRGGEG